MAHRRNPAQRLAGLELLERRYLLSATNPALGPTGLELQFLAEYERAHQQWHAERQDGGHDHEHDPSCSCPYCSGKDPHQEHEIRHSAHGRPYYLDPVPAEAFEQADEQPPVAISESRGEKVPLEELPQLSSDPGHRHSLYLDFNGHITRNTDWNESEHGGRDIHAAPYDLDGDPTTYSEEELAAIEEIFHRVREDFIPFDINVTTVEPAANDLHGAGRTVRAVISTNIDDKAMGGTGDEWFANAGGVAYIGSWLSRGDIPVWVFHNKLPKTPKAVAEATSHEFGHALGLSHDGGPGSAYYNGHGSGETGWAPIMGAAYHKNVTQWSRGQYSGATNSENDLDIITNVFNEVRYRRDDHGNWEPEATPLEPVGQQVLAAGIITESTDIDFFSFEHPGGPVSFSVAPAEIGPNLDIVTGLYDDDRNELIVAEPWQQLSASFEITLDPGTYYLFVEGGGDSPESGPGYNDYASLGAYQIQGILGERELSAVAGQAPYTLTEGENLYLDGSLSFGPDLPLTYSWDINGDGDFSDASGDRPTVPWERLVALSPPIDDDGAYEVVLAVADQAGNVATDTIPLTVQNRAPAVDWPTVPELVAGEPVTFAASASDVAKDPLRYRWDFGDGSDPVETPEATHRFAPGSYSVVLEVTDDEDATTRLVQEVTVVQHVPQLLGSSVNAAGVLVADWGIGFRFSEDVSASLNPSDLYLFDSDRGVVVNPDAPQVTWDAENAEAHFGLAGVAPGRYLIVLNGSGIHNSENVSVDADGDGDAGGNWSQDVIVTLPGDANLDLRVDFTDFLVLASRFGKLQASWEDGDFDGDGEVGFPDFLLLASHFDKP